MIDYKLISVSSIHDVLNIPKSIRTKNNLYIYLSCEKKYIKKQYTISCCGKIDFDYLMGKFYEKIKNYYEYNIVSVFIFDNDPTLGCGEKYVKFNDMISCWHDSDREKKINIYHMHTTGF